MSADLAERTAAAVDVLTATADRCQDVIEVLPLTTAEEEQIVANFARALAKVVKDSEEQRKALVAPIKARAKEIDDAFRGPRKRVEALSSRLRGRLQEAAQARETAKRKALEAARAAETAVEANAALATVEVAPETPGVSMRWRWEATGYVPEQIPREFLCIDVAKVQAACKDADKSGQAPQIPGVTFERKAHATVRKL